MTTEDLLIAVASLWAKRAGLRLVRHVHPDRYERRQKAVDLLSFDAVDVPRLVAEHTRVESFPAQRLKQGAAVDMFQPLEQELSGQLPRPGRYELSLAPSSIMGLKRKTGKIRAFAREWVVATAPGLKIGGPRVAPRHFAKTTVPGTPLTLWLFRWPGAHGRLRLVFHAPSESEQLLGSVVDKALTGKCAKLAAAAMAHPSASSLLLLEVADIALGNLFFLDPIVADRVAKGLPHPPDHI